MRALAIVIPILAFTGLYIFIEHFWPSIRGQKRFRTGWRTDIAWFVWQPTLGKIFSAILVFVSIMSLGALIMSPIPTDELRGLSPRETWVSAQPIWFQLLGVLLLGDLIGYWQHRAFHTIGVLWKFHSIHHSSTDLDWLSSARVHPINDVLSNIAGALPILVLGFSPAAFAAYVPILTLYAVMLHANVRWTLGPVGRVIASPVYHRWHHTSEQEGLNKNFAALFPWYDRIFRTYYCPDGVQPTRFGVAGERIPESFLGQLTYPFRRRKRAASGSALAVVSQPAAGQ